MFKTSNEVTLQIFVLLVCAYIACLCFYIVFIIDNKHVNMFQVFPSGMQYTASHLVRRVEILQDQDNVADAVPWWERNIG